MGTSTESFTGSPAEVKDARLVIPPQLNKDWVSNRHRQVNSPMKRYKSSMTFETDIQLGSLHRSVTPAATLACARRLSDRERCRP